MRAWRSGKGTRFKRVCRLFRNCGVCARKNFWKVNNFFMNLNILSGFCNQFKLRWKSYLYATFKNKTF